MQTFLAVASATANNTRMDGKPKRRAPYVTLSQLFAIVTIAAVRLHGGTIIASSFDVSMR